MRSKFNGTSKSLDALLRALDDLEGLSSEQKKEIAEGVSKIRDGLSRRKHNLVRNGVTQCAKALVSGK